MNIVSIDFDIIMAPSIQFYNHMVQDKQLFYNPASQFFNADLIHYHRLTQWLLKQAKNLSKQDIVFIQAHETIVNYVSKQDTIINIDHHHDLGYNHLDRQKSDEELYCGNWAQYLLENKLIKNYIWINNMNSNLNKLYQREIDTYHLQEYNLDNLIADKIIICYSPEWIPFQFRPLFFTWMNILESIYDNQYQILEF